KRAYCLKIQPATGSFARNLIYSTKPIRLSDLQQGALRNNIFYEEFISYFNHQEVSHETQKP
ncbi:hypothetical protein RAH05_26320, partial [Klebsiella pneumoniae]